MDLYFQGMAWLNKGSTPDNVAQARILFDRALSADPDNVEALIGSARADVAEGAMSFATDPMAAFAAAEAKLTKVLSFGPGPCARPYVVRSRSKYGPSGLRRASPNVSMRWGWIEILPTPMPLSDSVRFSSVAQKNQKLT